METCQSSTREGRAVSDKKKAAGKGNIFGKKQGKLSRVRVKAEEAWL